MARPRGRREPKPRDISLPCEFSRSESIPRGAHSLSHKRISTTLSDTPLGGKRTLLCWQDPRRREPTARAHPRKLCGRGAWRHHFSYRPPGGGLSLSSHHDLSSQFIRPDRFLSRRKPDILTATRRCRLAQLEALRSGYPPLKHPITRIQDGRTPSPPRRRTQARRKSVERRSPLPLPHCRAAEGAACGTWCRPTGWA